MVYFCEGCENNGDSRSSLKHAESCESKKVIKICMKSGKGMHLPKE